MEQITMCGYRCDLCKAYAPNIKANDQRQMLSQMWKKYYNLDIAREQIHCDGCRASEQDAKRIDMNCPVRLCVIERKIDHCGQCASFPCSTFNERKGLSFDEAKKEAGCSFSSGEFNEYLLAFDNLTRLKNYRK